MTYEPPRRQGRVHCPPAPTSRKHRAAPAPSSKVTPPSWLTPTARTSRPSATARTALVPRADAPPLNANPQDHCNGSVCVGAESVGGSGPDIIAAQVETRGMIPVPVGYVFYLNYGSSPANAKARIPFSYCIAESANLYGCSFSVNRILTPGWVLCGQISYYEGYPCITIG
jgi:hypothetical protein